MFDQVMAAARALPRPTAAVSAGEWPQDLEDYSALDMQEGDQYVESMKQHQAAMEGQFDDDFEEEDYGPEDLAGCVHAYILPQGYWGQEARGTGSSSPAAARTSTSSSPLYASSARIHAAQHASNQRWHSTEERRLRHRSPSRGKGAARSTISRQRLSTRKDQG